MCSGLKRKIVALVTIVSILLAGCSHKVIGTLRGDGVTINNEHYSECSGIYSIAKIIGRLDDNSIVYSIKGDKENHYIEVSIGLDNHLYKKDDFFVDQTRIEDVYIGNNTSKPITDSKLIAYISELSNREGIDLPDDFLQYNPDWICLYLKYENDYIISKKGYFVEYKEQYYFYYEQNKKLIPVSTEEMEYLNSFTLTGYNKDNRVPENVEGVFLHNQCTDYFYNIGDRYPANVIGTCGYTSASMLLMYYDYYYDDTLIEDKYEDRSAKPYGLLRVNLDEMTGKTATEYYDYLVGTQDELFQSYLITKANEKYNLYDINYRLPGALCNGSASRIPGYYEETQAVIDYYLYELRGKSTEQYITYRIKDNIRNTVIEKVKQGIPVLMSVKYKSQDSHILICYDYDEENDELYGNLLMVDNMNHLKLSSFYDTMTAPIVIEYVD